jgi:DNA-binding NtrC family response regulator
MRVALGGLVLRAAGGVGAELDHPRRPDSSRACPRRVLIVDDNRILAENLCEIVELSGYDALAVPSAEAALAAIIREPVDFILTDHWLPGTSGAALLLAVRSLGKRIPAVLTTAWIADDPTETAGRSGMTEVMGKPIDIEAFLSVIRRALGPPPASWR